MPPRKRTDTATGAKEFLADEAQAMPLKEDEIAHLHAPAPEPAVGPATGSGVTVSGVPDAVTPDWAGPLNAVNEQHQRQRADLLAALDALVAGQNLLADRLGNVEEWINPTDGPNLVDDVNAIGQRVRENENLLSTFIESVGKHHDSVNERFEWITDRLPEDPHAGRPAILDAIQGVMDDVQGVGKHGQMDPAARMGNYRYQRYDDLKRELGAAFRKHSVFLQSTTTNLVTERIGEGGRMTRVVVSVTYRFTSLADGSELTFDSHGESMDKSDKATGKAMTMALKTALTQAFMLAAEDTEDPDTTRPREEDDQPRREPHPTNADLAAAQRVEREYAVGEQVTVAGQTFVKRSDGPALGASGGPSYPDDAPKNQDDPWDQGPPKDTRTPEEAAQAAVVKLASPSLTLSEWTAISGYAKTRELLDVPITTPDMAKMALKHYLVAVARTLA